MDHTPTPMGLPIWLPGNMMQRRSRHCATCGKVIVKVIVDGRKVWIHAPS